MNRYFRIWREVCGILCIFCFLTTTGCSFVRLSLFYCCFCPMVFVPIVPMCPDILIKWLESRFALMLSLNRAFYCLNAKQRYSRVQAIVKTMRPLYMFELSPTLHSSRQQTQHPSYPSHLNHWTYSFHCTNQSIILCCKHASQTQANQRPLWQRLALLS